MAGCFTSQDLDAVDAGPVGVVACRAGEDEGAGGRARQDAEPAAGDGSVRRIERRAAPDPQRQRGSERAEQPSEATSHAPSRPRPKPTRGGAWRGRCLGRECAGRDDVAGRGGGSTSET
eukprot:326923-Rhodomonas_salina.1